MTKSTFSISLFSLLMVALLSLSGCEWIINGEEEPPELVPWGLRLEGEYITSIAVDSENERVLYAGGKPNPESGNRGEYSRVLTGAPTGIHRI